MEIGETVSDSLNWRFLLFMFINILRSSFYFLYISLLISFVNATHSINYLSPNTVDFIPPDWDIDANILIVLLYETTTYYTSGVIEKETHKYQIVYAKSTNGNSFLHSQKLSTDFIFLDKIVEASSKRENESIRIEYDFGQRTMRVHRSNYNNKNSPKSKFGRIHRNKNYYY